MGWPSKGRKKKRRAKPSIHVERKGCSKMKTSRRLDAVTPHKRKKKKRHMERTFLSFHGRGGGKALGRFFRLGGPVKKDGYGGKKKDEHLSMKCRPRGKKQRVEKGKKNGSEKGGAFANSKARQRSKGKKSFMEVVRIKSGDQATLGGQS